MSTKFGPSDIFIASVHASKFLLIILVLLLGVTTLSLFALTSHYIVVILFLPLIYWQGMKIIKKDALLRADKSIIQIQQHKEGIWRLTLKNKEEIFAKESAKAVRTTWFTIITLKSVPQGKVIRLVLAFDALEKKQYQLLTARLWQ